MVAALPRERDLLEKPLLKRVRAELDGPAVAGAALVDDGALHPLVERADE